MAELRIGCSVERIRSAARLAWVLVWGFAAAPAVAAAESVTFRYVPLPVGSIVAEYFDDARRFRLTDANADPGAPFHRLEQRYAMVLYEELTSRADGVERIDGTIVLANMWSGSGEPQPKPLAVHGKRYRFENRNGAIARFRAVDRDAGNSELLMAERMFKRPAFAAELGHFLDGRTAAAGAVFALPEELSRRLAGVAGASLTFVGVETRWQRKVARFALRASRAALGTGRLQSLASVAGQVLVDLETARALHIVSRAPLTMARPIAAGRRRIDHHGHGARTRAFVYSDVPLFGQDVELVVPTGPAGNVGQITVTHDDDTVAIVSDDPGAAGGASLMLWDRTLRRQATRSNALVGPYLEAPERSAMLLNYDRDANGVALARQAADIGVFGHILRTDAPGVTAFGSLGAYGLVGNAHGELRVYNFGHNRELVKKTSERPLEAVHASIDAGFVASVDADARLRVFALETDARSCSGAPYAGYCAALPFTLGSTPRTDRPLVDAKPASVRFDATGTYLTYARVRGGSRVERVDGTEAFEVAGLAPRFAGRKVATTAGLFNLRGEPLSTFATDPTRAPAQNFAVTRDASTLLVPDGDAVRVVDVASGLETERIGRRVAQPRRVYWYRGGLLMLHAEGITAVDFATGETSRNRIDDLLDVQFATVDDDLVMALQTLSAGVFVTRISPSGARPVMPIYAGLVERMELDPGGQWLTLTGADGIRAYTLRDGRLLAHLPDQHGRAWVTPDLARLIVLTTDALRVVAPDGSVVAERPLALKGGALLAMPANGTRIAVGPLRADPERGWHAAIPLYTVLDTATLSTVTDLYPRWTQGSALAFTPDGAQIVLGGTDGSLLTWSAETGVLLSQWQGHDAEVRDLRFRDDATLLSAGRDGLARVWDLRAITPAMPPLGFSARTLEQVLMFGGRRLHLLASIALVDGEHYAIATPDGYYAASKQALTSLAFRRKLAGLYTFSEFDLWLNRPDIVLSRLGALTPARQVALRRALARRLQRYGSSDPVAEFWTRERPTLELVSRPGGSIADEAAIVQLETTSSATLALLQVLVNGVPVTAQPLAGNAYRGNVSVPLLAGANLIEAYVEDVNGGRSERRSVAVNRTAASSRPALWIVTIGVSEYADERIRLRYAAKDARDLAAFFAAAGAQRFSAVRTLTLTDSEVTAASPRAIRAFLSDAKPDDHVMVFASGHGFLDAQRDYYFGTFDVDPNAPATRGLSYDDLLSVFDGVAAHRRVLMLDSCHSGEVDADVGTAALPAFDVAAGKVTGTRGIGVVKAKPVRDLEGSFQVLRDQFVSLREQGGVNVVAAAGGLEYALESDRFSNGVFTFALMEALQGQQADADGSGTTSLSELRTWVIARVKALTRGGQRPASRAENIYLDFDIL
ncbi:MAG: caspase family protein [Pseudomonadota bacterium]